MKIKQFFDGRTFDNTKAALMHKGKYLGESARKQPKKATLTHDSGHMGKAPTPSRPQHVPDGFARKRPPRMR